MAFDNADGATLTLRARAADLLQMQSAFLATTAFQNPTGDELTAIRLDLSLDTAVDQLH